MSIPNNILSIIKEQPHWRVNFRSLAYNQNIISSIAEITRIIEKNKLDLRGWDYPHYSQNDEIEFGTNYFASFVDFMGNLEYLRFYQSSQFLHIFAVKEERNMEWKNNLRDSMRSHLDYLNINWEDISGYFSITNFVYTVTEIVEFASRLCQYGLYNEGISINIGINNCRNFLLSVDFNRVFWKRYQLTTDNLSNDWVYKSSDLIDDSLRITINIVLWFFERFGWLNPSIDVIKQDILNLTRKKQ